VVIDPRAGHGPGIGGFKLDSEIGIALKFGHPCYFVMFFPQPLPGQTIESVCAAEVEFLRHVGELHPQADKPFVIGNCQGGWALLMAASLAPEAVGPLLLAGSPISYWAGVEGKNPMRYSGGLLGGTWMASMAGDIGHGIFDGAYLVNNFEGLNPSNTSWSKLYNLYAKVDTEGERFLEFEKWWGGHYLMNKQEMEWISQNLFVGNKLSSGQVESFDGKHRVDLRNIRTPIIVFASWGDNITPPQQALNWIADLYDSVDDIRLNEQTLVYCLHDKIGHLGIFVSAGVAQRETSELAGALELIDTLPPGLYEALIQDTTPDMPGLEYVDGRYLIQFVPRGIDDILALDDGRGDERAFEVANRVSRQPAAVRPIRLAAGQGDVQRAGGTRAARDQPGAFGTLVVLRPQSGDGLGRVDGRVGAHAAPAGVGAQPAAAGRAPDVGAHRAGARPIPRRARRDGRPHVQGDLRIALARGRGRAGRAQRCSPHRTACELGARGAQAAQAQAGRRAFRAWQLDRCLGTPAAVPGPRAQARR
jgi:pimeloyl-ACP methyl ester carboxylesterase